MTVRKMRAKANGAAHAPGNGAATGPAVGAPDEGFIPLPLLQEKETDHPCFQCAKCCTYVAIEIDPPRSNAEYDYMVWYLYHPGIQVFVDWEGAWFVKFDSRCQHLTPTGLCGVYETRPAICRDFDWRECEQTVKDEPADRWLFETAEQFLAWFKKQRPRAHKRFQQFLREKRRGRTERELRRVKITSLGAPGVPPRSGGGGRQRPAGGVSGSTSRSSSLRC